MLTPTLLNGVEMNAFHPTTFEIPSVEEIKSLQPGDHVKVCAENERFWVLLKSNDGETLVGVIDNHLIYTDKHGLDFKMEIQFSYPSVLAYGRNRSAK